MENSNVSSKFPFVSPMVLGFLAGSALGAFAMFYADPTRGRARRARVRDQGISAGRHAIRDGEKIVQDAKNRAVGVIARAARPFRSGKKEKSSIEGSRSI